MHGISMEMQKLKANLLESHVETRNMYLKLGKSNPLYNILYKTFLTKLYSIVL